ncbi:MAG: acyl-ACP desaturase, partial [Nanoarchaeota archaeon]
MAIMTSAKLDRLDPKEAERRTGVLKSLEDTVMPKALKYLPADRTRLWQPEDILKVDFTQDGWVERIKEIQDCASGLPTSILAVTGGNAITEGAITNYESQQANASHIDWNPEGEDGLYKIFAMRWTAEEMRHDRGLAGILSYGGRTDMRIFNTVTQNLVANGFNPDKLGDPYHGVFYPVVQEYVTLLSHRHTGQLADQHGDFILGELCTRVGGDEDRHYLAYNVQAKGIIKADPKGALESILSLMKITLQMPALLMSN